MLTKTTRGRSSSLERSQTRLVCTSTPIPALATISAPSTTRSAATVSPPKPGSPGVSIRLILRSCHSRWQIEDASDIWRRCSSSSQSEVVEPCSTLPRRLIAPPWKSIDSTSDVLPVPRCPVTATLRILPASIGPDLTVVSWPLDVVAERSRLPDLPAVISGLGRRRDRRPARRRAAARLPHLARRRRVLALADLPLAARRLRLRRLRLHGDRSGLRDDGRLRLAGQRGARAGAEDPPRPRPIAHLHRASLVPRASGLVHLVAGRRAA